MPSVQIGLVSGGQIVLSGDPWSGTAGYPQGLVVLRWERAASGNVYIALSGNMTVNSGGFSTSGGFAHSGLLDGMQLGPGDVYTIPKLALKTSGTCTIYATPDAAASGNRIFFEVF